MDTSDILREIPVDELSAFEKNIHICKSGEIIIHEGENNDNTLYLVRKGVVGIYRELNGTNELITTIEEMNFFGEMELIIGGNRLATVSPISEIVILYVFKNPDLSKIITNPMLGGILVTRLSHDLKEFSTRSVEAQKRISALETKFDHLCEQLSLLMSLFAYFQSNIGSIAVLGTKEWNYLVGIREMIHNFIRVRRIPIETDVKRITSTVIADLTSENILPSKLSTLITDQPQKH